MEMQNYICTILLDVGSPAKHFYYYGARVPALPYMAKVTKTAGASLWSVSVFCQCFNVSVALCYILQSKNVRCRIGKTVCFLFKVPV